MDFKDQSNFSPDVEHITELNSDLSLRERTCWKTKDHKQYITMDQFNDLCQMFSRTKTQLYNSSKDGKSILLKGFNANKKLIELLNCMSDLTGLIVVDYGKSKLTFWERFVSIWPRLLIILCGFFSLIFKNGNRATFCKSLRLSFEALLTGFSMEKHIGSGFVQKIRGVANKPCPCHICAKSVVPKRRYSIVTITTVLHVFDKESNQALTRGFIKGTWRSENAKVRLFYDREGDKKRYLYGHRLLETDKEFDIKNDWCAVECVTHDMALIGKLEHTLEKYMTLQGEIYKDYTDNIGNYKGLEHLVIIIGHPHGGPKKISVGEHNKKVVLNEVRNSQRWCSYEYTNITCGGSSGSPVFILGQALCGFGYWFGHPHNHSKTCKVEPLEENSSLGKNSSVGVECI